MPPTIPSPILNRLSLGELLSFSTIQLHGESATGMKSGTGFIVEFRPANSTDRYPMLITNKHVVEGAERLTFVLTIRDLNGLPTQETYPCVIPLHEWFVVSRPSPEIDWDVCAIPLAPLFQSMQAAGKLPMLFSLEIHDLEKKSFGRCFGAVLPIVYDWVS